MVEIKRKKQKGHLIGAWVSDDEQQMIVNYCEKNRLVIGPFFRKTVLDFIDKENLK